MFIMYTNTKKETTSLMQIPLLTTLELKSNALSEH